MNSNYPSSERDLFPPCSKICFLVCDPTKAEFIDAYEDFINLLISTCSKFMLRRSGLGTPSLVPEALKSSLIFPFNAFEGNFPELETIEHYDSTIVSGSSTSFITQPWIPQLGNLLHAVATEYPSVKIISVCFGHQIISHSVFGEPVRQNPKWEIRPGQVRLAGIGKVLSVDETTSLSPPPNAAAASQNLHFSHFSTAAPYATVAPKNEYMIWGSSQQTTNQGIIAPYKNAPRDDNLNIDDIHIFTTQSHPEMTSGMISLLIDIFEKNLVAKAYKEERERIANFAGSLLDWFPLCLLMGASSMKHSVTLSQLYESAQGCLNVVQDLEKSGMSGYPLTPEKSVVIAAWDTPGR
ncbi:class I glutamine amidotransferase-like protein [Coprinopsis sp. MPI-PUGE-AT-0042]|nr:class I glutamine amidotransferase-like protein [Coprinopsis sp. MPI-PUGE-AT-0042]